MTQPQPQPQPRHDTVPNRRTGRVGTGRVGTRARVLRIVLLPAVVIGGGVALPARLAPTCAEAAAMVGQINVGLVIDYGAGAGAPSGPKRECVVADDRATGYAVLQTGNHPIRVNDSGLLCAIDGYPAGTECGERTATGYRYWAYFHGNGSGGWSYSNIGPGGYRVQAGAVEGWHFVEGKGNPSDPAPAGSSDPTLLCGSPPPTTSSPSPTVPGPTVAPPTSTRVSTPNPSVAPTPGAPPATVAQGGGNGTPKTIGGGGVAPSGTTPEGAAAPGAGSTDTSAADGGPEPRSPDGWAGSVGSVGSVAPVGNVDNTAPGTSPTSERDASSSGSAPWLAVVLIVAVGALAGWRFRRRPAQ